jgi:hypothetical protein
MSQTVKEEPQLAVRSNPLYVMRIISVRSQSMKMERACVIVFPDNKFHMEKSKQDVGDTKPRAQMVFEGQLSEAQIAQLAKLLQDPDVASAPDSIQPGRMIPFQNKARLIAAEIPRDKYRTQQISGVQVETEHTDSALQSLISFVDGLDSRDLTAVKDAKPTFCRTPHGQPLKK